MKLEIWFEFASTYSYLTVARAEPLLRANKIAFEWKPFLLGPIFRDKGMDTSPFVLDPQKGVYMWRDLERRAAHYGLPYAKPPEFPLNPILAARVMTASINEDWSGNFARAVFHAQFVQGHDIADPAVIRQALEDCGADAIKYLDLAGQERTKTDLRHRTAEAVEAGIFGAPTFRIGRELFWGDDRLEDAIAWAKNSPATARSDRGR